MKKIWGFTGERMADENWQAIMMQFSADGESLYSKGRPVGVLSHSGTVDKWLHHESKGDFEALIEALPEEHHGVGDAIKTDEATVIEFLGNFSKAKKAIDAAKEPLLIGMLPAPFPGAPDVPIEVTGGTMEEMRKALTEECPDAFVFNDVL